MEHLLEANNIRPHAIELLGCPSDFSGVVLFAVVLASVKNLVGQSQIAEVEIANSKGFTRVIVHESAAKDLPLILPEQWSR